MRANPTSREFAVPDVLRVVELLASNRGSVLPLLVVAIAGSTIARAGDAAARSQSGHAGSAALPLPVRFATHTGAAGRHSEPDPHDPAGGCSNMLGVAALCTVLAAVQAASAITRSHVDPSRYGCFCRNMRITNIVCSTACRSFWRLQFHTTASAAVMRTCYRLLDQTDGTAGCAAFNETLLRTASRGAR